MTTIDDRHFLKGPWLLLLWGAPAAGKTTVAKSILAYWAQRGLIVPHLSSDALNRAMIGEHFQRELRPIIYEGLLTMAESILKSGRPLVLDGTFLEQKTRNRIREMAALQLHVQITCPLSTRLLRNAARSHSERVPNAWVRDAHYKAEFARRDANLVIDTSALSHDETRDHILNALALRLRRQYGLTQKSEALFR